MLLTAFFATLAGCGVDVPSERPAAPITGTVADNIVRNGDVRVYAWNGKERDILLTTKTDAYGYYIDPLQAESQFIKICIVSGEYTEEASSINIRLENDDRLCSVTYWQSGTKQDVMVTPETNLAVALMEYEVKAGNSNLQSVVSSANTKIGTLFGYDILKTKPADMTSDNLLYTGLNDSIRSGLWHAAFSRLALEAAKANGLSTHTSLISSIALHKALYRDLAADGKLDGWGMAENGSTKVKLGLGSYDLNAHVYRTELARELVNFVKSDRNKTAVKTNDVLSFATTFSLTTDSVFSDKDIPTAFDDKAPTIALNTPENTYISGTYTLGVKVTDFSGVKAVSYTLNGGNPQDFDFTQESLVIDTKQFNNGDFEIAITATDNLDNEGTIKRTFRVANEQPMVNITSRTLVNETNYLFTADIGEVKAGVNRVTLNGTNAEYADGKITVKNVRLNQGENNLFLVVYDATGAEYSYNWNVDVDTKKPDVEWKPTWNILFKKLNNSTELDFILVNGQNDKILITPPFFKLNGLGVDENSLESAKWPTIKFEISDNSTATNTYSSKLESLNIQVQHLSNSGLVYLTRLVTTDDNGVLLIPLSEEFLGEKWYEKTGSNLIRVTVIDEAGNSVVKNYPINIHVNSPKIDMGLSLDTHLNGLAALQLNGTDLVGIDYITFSINGGIESTLTNFNNNPFFSLNTINLTDGAHTLTAKIYSGDSQSPVKQQEYEFSVDNTPPSLNITSPELVNSKTYTLTGSTSDDGSGLNGGNFSLNNSVAINLPMLSGKIQSIQKTNISLLEGENTFKLEVKDLAGNVTEKEHHVFYDIFKPIFSPIFGESGELKGSTSKELYEPTQQVKGGFTHDPKNNPLEDIIGTGEVTPLHLYLDDKISNLNVEIGDVGIGSNQYLIKDGKLDIENKNSIDYLNANDIAYFSFEVSDSKHNDGRVADISKVQTYLSVEIGGQVITNPNLPNGLLKKVNNHIGGSAGSVNYYIVPITTELFGLDLLAATSDDIIKATFKIVDEAGNETLKSYKFKVFNKPIGTTNPTITNFTKPAGILKSHNTATPNITSPYGISSVSWKVNGIEKSNFNHSNKLLYEHTLPSLSCWGANNCTVELSVTDLAGNNVSDTYSTIIDNLAPTLSVNYSSNVTNNFTVSWTINDTNPSYVMIDGNVYWGKSGVATVSVSGADGSKQFTAKAYDKAGNISQNYTFTYQSTYQHQSILNRRAFGPVGDYGVFSIMIHYMDNYSIVEDTTGMGFRKTVGTYGVVSLTGGARAGGHKTGHLILSSPYGQHTITTKDILGSMY